MNNFDKYTYFYEVHHTNNTVKRFANRNALLYYLYRAPSTAQNVTVQQVHCDILGELNLLTIATYAIPKKVLEYAQKIVKNSNDFVDSLFAQNISSEECQAGIDNYNKKMRPLIDKEVAHIVDIEVL